VSTLRAWCVGQAYSGRDGDHRRFQNVICLDGLHSEGLSFMNLVEAHVLTAIRRIHNIPLGRVRTAVDYLRREFKVERPLADQQLETDGVDLFVTAVLGEDAEQVINVTRSGQVAMTQIVRAYLKRIERDPKGVPIKLYPITRSDRRAIIDAPRAVEMDPRVSFGRPVLVGRSVPTAVLADRFKAGDSLSDLAADFETSPSLVEEAIRCELDRRKAA
jgi:uncharacterized protein (DUF433 family)